MRIDPKFPRSRVDMPMRRMEYTIHQILQETGLGGKPSAKPGSILKPGRFTSPWGWKGLRVSPLR